MNVKHLMEIYVNNLDKIFIAENFKTIAYHGNKIQGCSFLNRILIFTQNKYATDIRNETYWSLAGRKIKHGAVPIGITVPISETKYFYTKNNEEITLKSAGITPEEFKKAIEIGVITKKISVGTINHGVMYDITDTVIIDNKLANSKNTDEIQKLKMSTIYKKLNQIGVKVEKTTNTKTTYAKNRNALLLGSDRLADKLICSLKILVDTLLSNRGQTIAGLGEKYQLVLDYVGYAICTYFGIKTSIDFIYLDKMNWNLEELNELVSLLDDLEYNIVFEIVSGDANIKNMEYMEYILSKASILKSTMDAFAEASKLI